MNKSGSMMDAKTRMAAKEPATNETKLMDYLVRDATETKHLEDQPTA